MLKLQIIGRLTKDPETRTTQQGKTVANFTLATNLKKNETIFIDCSAWDQKADLVMNYLSKGKQVYVSGTPSTEAYTSKQDGEAKSKLKITVYELEFLSNNQEPTVQREPTPLPDVAEIDLDQAITDMPF